MGEPITVLVSKGQPRCFHLPADDGTPKCGVHCGVVNDRRMGAKNYEYESRVVDPEKTILGLCSRCASDGTPVTSLELSNQIRSMFGLGEKDTPYLTKPEKLHIWDQLDD